MSKATSRLPADKRSLRTQPAIHNFPLNMPGFFYLCKIDMMNIN